VLNGVSPFLNKNRATSPVGFSRLRSFISFVIRRQTSCQQTARPPTLRSTPLTSHHRRLRWGVPIAPSLLSLASCT